MPDQAPSPPLAPTLAPPPTLIERVMDDVRGRIGSRNVARCGPTRVFDVLQEAMAA